MSNNIEVEGKHCVECGSEIEEEGSCSECGISTNYISRIYNKEIYDDTFLTHRRTSNIGSIILLISAITLFSPAATTLQNIIGIVPLISAIFTIPAIKSYMKENEYITITRRFSWIISVTSFFVFLVAIGFS